MTDAPTSTTGRRPVQKILDGLNEALDYVRALPLPPNEPDGCCHKTRLQDGPCPLGWKCPFIKDATDV